METRHLRRNARSAKSRHVQPISTFLYNQLQSQEPRQLSSASTSHENHSPATRREISPIEPFRKNRTLPQTAPCHPNCPWTPSMTKTPVQPEPGQNVTARPATKSPNRLRGAFPPNFPLLLSQPFPAPAPKRPEPRTVPSTHPLDVNLHPASAAGPLRSGCHLQL